MTLLLLSCHTHNTKGLMPRSCSWTWVADVEDIGWSEAKQALGSKPQQWAVCWCVGSPPLIPWRVWVSLANEQESVWHPSTAAFWNMSVVFLPGDIWLTLSCYRSSPVWNAMHNFSHLDMLSHLFISSLQLKTQLAHPFLHIYSVWIFRKQYRLTYFYSSCLKPLRRCYTLHMWGGTIK